MAEADEEVRQGQVYDVTDTFWDDLVGEVSARAARGERPSDDVLP